MTTSTSALGAVIAANRDAVESDPAKAAVVFRAEATAHDAVASSVVLRNFRVEVDEPPALGGADTAANPVEYYLASL
ncbi:OsmC family peroxiredoxin, partial [Nocardia puris]|uniref:OsmC family protein n=2 Tax=Nocardia TaxID=1817 RepID=UPI0034DDBE14|nr:OsmC family peroxiredoxin [Nocardia puris]